jgi:hypothetical protein
LRRRLALLNPGLGYLALGLVGGGTGRCEAADAMRQEPSDASPSPHPRRIGLRRL